VDNAITVRLGVDIASFRPGPHDEALRARLGIPSDVFLLLYVGRLSGEKNVLTLLRAFEQLHAVKPGKYHLAVIGDGPLRPEVLALQSMIPHVTWLPYISDNAELARHYHLADLFVHPGVCETFGLVTMEAQASGLPVCGIRGSRMDANVFGGLELWADRNTPAALAAAIERMAQQDLKSLGKKVATVVREHFSWERVFERMWRCYRGETLEPLILPPGGGEVSRPEFENPPGS
jgi:alpha-1,6-mannosyltransferase